LTLPPVTTGWTNGGSVTGARNICVFRNFRPGSGAHADSYWVISVVINGPRREADHSTSTNAELQSARSYDSIPPLCLHVLLVKNLHLTAFFNSYKSKGK